MPVFALSMYCYATAFVSVPILLALLAALLLLAKKVKLKEAFACLGAFLLFAWPLAILMAINLLKMETVRLPFMSIPYFADTQRASSFAMFSEEPLKALLGNAKAILNTCILQSTYEPWNTIKGYGAIYLFMPPFAPIGLWLAKKAKATPLLAWLGASVLLGLMVNSVNTNRVNIIFYPLILVCAMGAAKACDLISEKLRKAKAAPYAIAAAALAISSAMFGRAYFTTNAATLSRLFMEGFNEAFDYAESRNPDVVHVTFHTQSKRSYWVSEAMILYSSAMDPKYLRGEKEIERGGKTLLPKEERYICAEFEEPVSPAANAGYIFNVAEQSLFPDELFEVHVFGNFGAAFARQ
jgi:hypothetical protein